MANTSSGTAAPIFALWKQVWAAAAGASGAISDGRAVIAGEHPLARAGLGGGEAIAIGAEVLDGLRVVQTLPDDVGTHGAARLFGKEADDLVAAAFALLE